MVIAVPSMILFFSFLPASPFEVQVGPEAGMQKVRAWGPGLHGGIVGRSADFVVESIGSEVGTLGK
jgi:filamin